MMLVKGIVGGDALLTEFLIKGLTLNGAAESYCVGNFDEVVGNHIESKYGVKFIKNIDDFIGSSALLFLTFDFTETEKILPHLAKKINPESLIVSAVPELKLKKLEEHFPENEIIRLFITPSIISGQGLGAYVVSQNASINAQSVAEIILKDCGDVINVADEKELEKVADFFTANTYMSYVMIQNMLRGAKKLGMTQEEANFAVVKIFSGAVFTLIEGGKDNSAMIRRTTVDQRYRTKVTKLIDTQGIKKEMEKFIERPIYAEIIEAEDEEKIAQASGKSTGNRFSNTAASSHNVGFSKKAKKSDAKTSTIKMHYRKEE